MQKIKTIRPLGHPVNECNITQSRVVCDPKFCSHVETKPQNRFYAVFIWCQF